MRETIFLAVDRAGVRRMTKRLPDLNRGEIPVKLVVEIDDTAFREPVIERHVHVTDWREGIDIADIQLKESIITEQEAELIRARRLAKMREILEGQGYEVNDPASGVEE